MAYRPKKPKRPLRPPLTRKVVKRHGHVRWFSAVKGYGFINEDHSPEDIFFHFSVIQTPGYKNLDEDQRVVFEMARPKGKAVATCVVPVNPPEGADLPPTQKKKQKHQKQKRAVRGSGGGAGKR